MIPVTLRLENFLSYGENLSLLDFSGFHLACLTGQNGHGKSSLLDAITWALWGQARKASTAQTPDSSLLKLGENKMWVELVFDLGRERYKVYREFVKSQKSQRSTLEFFVREEACERYRSLTEDSKKKTQAKICQFLGLEYQTFINSAFIVQGKADEFTKKTAKERKDILAKILNLDYYEKLATLAKSKAKELTIKTELLQQQNLLTDNEKEFLASWPARLKVLNAEKTVTATSLKKIEGDLNSLRASLTRYELKQIEFKELTIRSPQIGEEIESITEQLEHLHEELIVYEKFISKETKIKNCFAEYRNLKTKVTEEELKSKQIISLKENKHLVELSINDKTAKLQKTSELLAEKLNQNKDRQNEITALLEEKPQIIKLFNQYEKAVEEENSLLELKKDFELLQNQLTALEQSAYLEKQKLVSRLTALKEERSRIEPDDQSMTRSETLKNSLASKTKALEHEIKQLEAKSNEKLTLKTAIESLAAKKKETVKLLFEIKEKSVKLKEATSPECPLCESELPPPKKETLIKKLAAQEKSLSTEIEKMINQIQVKTERLSRLNSEIEVHEIDLKFGQKQVEALTVSLKTSEIKELETTNRLNEIAVEINQLDSQLENKDYLAAHAEKLQGIKNELKRLNYQNEHHQKLLEFLKKEAGILSKRQWLQNAEAEDLRLKKTAQELVAEKKKLLSQSKSEDYIRAENENITTIEKEIATLAFSETELQAIKKTLIALESAPIELAQLNQAIKAHPQTKKRITSLTKSLQKKNDEFTSFKTHIEQLDAELHEHIPDKSQLTTLTNLLNEKRQVSEKLIAQIAEGEREQQIISRKEKELQAINKQLKTMGEEKRLFECLHGALGKNGIPAFIIENILPELELTANDILRRLTNGRTQLTFASTRDLKSGGSRETLEIIIADEQGARNYELFSGGEAFRINFALRIAIAKLLAKRAGASLKLLIIDEGFGTQDEEGLNYLIGAIKHISDDFEKLIVVTHLTDLQQAFPVHITVYKDPEYGSRFEVTGT